MPIQITLTPDGKAFCHGKAEYKWPDDEFDYVKPDGISAADLNKLLFKAATVALDKSNAKPRYVIANFSDVDPEDMKVRVTLEICPLKDEPSCDTGVGEGIKRVFTLNFFSFPTIDNTRLPNNDRFALVLENFSLGSTAVPIDCPTQDGHKELQCLCEKNPSTLTASLVLFPAEYASLRDRPTLRESLHLLESAQGKSREEE